MTQTAEKKQAHCIRTEKVYDWIKTIVEITKKKTLKLPLPFEKIIKDNVCIKFKVNCNDSTPTTIWQSVNIISTVSFSITYSSKCECDLTIFIDDQKLTTLKPGQIFSATVGHLDHISVLCEGENGSELSCNGELNLSINYKIVEGKSLNDITSSRCFLSNKDGDPVTLQNKDAFVCDEVRATSGRKMANFHLSNSQAVTLHDVMIRCKFFITIELLNSEGTICYSCTFPIDQVKNVKLCAPNGTIIKSTITDFICESFINQITKNCIEICFTIQLCKDIKSIHEATLQIDGRLCKPHRSPTIEHNCSSLNENKSPLSATTNGLILSSNPSLM